MVLCCSPSEGTLPHEFPGQKKALDLKICLVHNKNNLVALPHNRLEIAMKSQRD